MTEKQHKRALKITDRLEKLEKRLNEINRYINLGEGKEIEIFVNTGGISTLRIYNLNPRTVLHLYRAATESEINVLNREFSEL